MMKVMISHLQYGGSTVTVDEILNYVFSFFCGIGCDVVHVVMEGVELAFRRAEVEEDD
jgi:hypothetical protein